MKQAVKYIILVAIAVALTLYLGDGCNESPPIKDSSDSIKTVIKTLVFKKDSLQGIASKKDSVRTKEVVKWRELKRYIYIHDTIPCDSLLPIVINTCDSVISADSSLIVTLKNVIRNDSSIISNQAKIIVSDSTQIAVLNKEIKKHKRHKVGLLAALAVMLGIAVAK